MSAIRFCAVAAIALAAVAQAAVGNTASCPAAGTAQRLYGNDTISCTAATTCQTTYCTCIGGTRRSGLMCDGVTTKPTCAAASTCAAALITCLNKAADPSNNCTGLKDLHMSLLALETGAQLYNASQAYRSCKYRTCQLVNASAGNNCSLTFKTLCESPVAFTGTVLLRGNFTEILANPAQVELMAVALENDLARSLGITGVFVQRIYALGTSPLPPVRTRPPARRQQDNTALVVEFMVPGVTARNTAFNNALTTVKANGDWLQATTQQYSTLTGGQTLTFLGVAEGTGSSAFSSGQIASFLAPPAPGVPPATTPAPTAGAATQSMLAAAVIAILSALLF